MFATLTATGVAVLDPRTGSLASIPTFGLTKAEQAWLDDGEGFLLTDDPIAAAGGEIMSDSYVIDMQGRAMDAAGRHRFLDPLRAPALRDGVRVVECTDESGTACASVDRGGSALIGRDGSVSPVFAPIRRDRFLRGTAFAPDGDVLGVFEDLSVDRRLVVERDDGSGGIQRVAEVPVRAGTGDVWVDAIAPDASLFVAGRASSGGDYGPILLPDDGGPGTYHHGSFVGLLPVDIARQISGGPFAVVPDSAAPAVGARPSLPGAEELRRSVQGDILLEATGPDATGATTTKLGKLSFDWGAGVMMACVGGGRLTVTIDVEMDHIDCSVGLIGGGSSGRTGTMSVTVTAPEGVQWRIVVYDARPPEPSGWILP
jgi:hypothetical protein